VRGAEEDDAGLEADGPALGEDRDDHGGHAVILDHAADAAGMFAAAVRTARSPNRARALHPSPAAASPPMHLERRE
jgi:hypothetical protein